MHKPSTPPIANRSSRSSLLIFGCRLLGLVVVLHGGVALMAQASIPKKAQKRLNSAVELYMQRDAQAAMQAVEEAIDLYEAFPDAWMLKSQLHEAKDDWDAASTSLAKALEHNPQLVKKWGEKLMRLYFRAGDYAQAFELLDRIACSDSLLEQSVRFSHEAVQQPIELELAPLPGNVNSPAPEYYPALYATGDRMVFTRQLGGDARMTGQEDFFEAERTPTGEWRVVRAIQEINTPGNEGAPTVRGDGRQLIFTACDGLDGSYGRRSGEGSCDLFVADFDVSAGRFKRDVNLASVNSRAWESQPSLSTDGHWLFFVRAYRAQDGTVVQDIYQSENLGSQGWSRPSRLPAQINTPGREENPVLHSDGKTLYFASNGHAGLGGLDLYVSRRQPDGSWSEAVNLGYPINSNGDENSLQVFPDGKTALFATDRDEPGNLDLWAFELPDHAKAEEVALWQGMVRDAATKRPIGATVQVLDESGRRMGEQRSSDSDGAFTLTFPITQRVILQVDEPGFAFYSEVLEPATVRASSVVVELNRLEIGTVLVLRDVRFERSSAELNADFQPDLEQLARTLKTSDVRIRIAGHTDGEGSAERNQTLSEARAQAVMDFLLALGIAQQRMESVGFGMMRPIASNETPEGRALNRRTEIEIIQ